MKHLGVLKSLLESKKGKDATWYFCVDESLQDVVDLPCIVEMISEYISLFQDFQKFEFSRLNAYLKRWICVLLIDDAVLFLLFNAICQWRRHLFPLCLGLLRSCWIFIKYVPRHFGTIFKHRYIMAWNISFARRHQTGKETGILTGRCSSGTICRPSSESLFLHSFLWQQNVRV